MAFCAVSLLHFLRHAAHFPFLPPQNYVYLNLRLNVQPQWLKVKNQTKSCKLIPPLWLFYASTSNKFGYMSSADNSN
jgi:hypothetical protein